MTSLYGKPNDFKRNKNTIWLTSMKKPLHPQQTPKSKVTTQNRHQTFDYTTIADQLRTVSWSINSHPTDVVKLVYGIKTFPLSAYVMLSKGQTSTSKPYNVCSEVAIFNLRPPMIFLYRYDWPIKTNARYNTWYNKNAISKILSVQTKLPNKPNESAEEDFCQRIQ